MEITIVLLVTFIAAMVNAVAGGGTFLTFPTLTGIAQLTEKAANMTSTIGIWPGAAASVVAAKQELRRLPRAMTIAFVLISLVGGVIGAVLLQKTSQHAFKLLVPWLLAFATVVFAFSRRIARWAGRAHGGHSAGWIIFVAWVQLLVAVYGGYFGAGIGILMLAGLSFAGLDDIHQMNGLKVLLQTVINGVASVIFLFSPDVKWSLALPMAAVAIVGGFFGITLARRIPQTPLRMTILLIGIALTAAYFVKTYHPF
jgi:uncharacterized membrane protein YfcA